jgi:hypothetical protein
MLIRGLVLFLLVATASPVWGGVLYECAHDGVLRSSCCCPSGHSQDGAPVVLENACCAVRPAAIATSQALSVEERSGKFSPPTPGALPHTLVPGVDVLPGAVGASSLAAGSPPRTGSSPLFIQLRMLLI